MSIIGMHVGKEIIFDNNKLQPVRVYLTLYNVKLASAE